MTENDLYQQIAQYLNLSHNNLIYHFDLSGMWTSSHKQRNLYGRLNRRGWPDLFIAQPSDMANGLFLELKRAGTRVRKKDGTYADLHVAEQASTLDRLEQKGYAVGFAVGYDEAIEIIEAYLSGNYPAVV